MKFIPLLVGLSLAANVALVAYVRRPYAPSPSAHPVPLSISVESAPSAPHAPPDEAQAVWAAVAPERWAHLSPAEFLAQLRLAGFPSYLQRALLRDAIRRQFAPQHLELLRTHPEQPFWDSRYERGYDPKLASAQRRLNKEQQEMLKSLLGSSAEDPDEYRDYLRNARFGAVPPDKIEQLERIRSDYSDLRHELYREAGDLQLPQDRERRALLEREERADIAAILGPDELRDYELRNGRVASSLRSSLGTFQPSEAEFVAIHEAFRIAEEQLGSSDFRGVRSAVVAAMKDQLDPARLTALEQAFDPAYSGVNRIVARLNLPPTTSHEVVQLQRDSTAKAQALQRERNLSPAERSARLAELNRDVTTRLTGLLGESGLTAYRDSGGHWLRMLNPPVRTPNASRP